MPVHKFWKSRFGRGGQVLNKLPNASVDDEVEFARVAVLFEKHLQNTYSAITVKEYGSKVRKLFHLHCKSPTVMASKQYIDAVRGLGLHINYSVSIQAFSSFINSMNQTPDASGRRMRGTKRKAEENCEMKPMEMKRTVRVTKALAHLEDASVTDTESCPYLLASFKKYLTKNFLAVTAKQYLQNFQRLLCVHQKSPQAMASREYLESMQRLGMRGSQVAAVKAFCRFQGLDVEDDIHSQCHRANNEAQRRLALAKQHGRPVSDADVLAVLRIWGWFDNKHRANVFPQGAKSVHSATFGLTRDRRGRLLVSNSTDGSEDVMRLMCQWLKDQLGKDSFPFTSISINKGYAAAKHRDKGNEGPSATRAVGNFQDGALRYWHGISAHVPLATLCEAHSVLLDSRHGVVFFDGNYPHAVEEFVGERFSAVFFTASGYQRASPVVCNSVKKLGARWPTARTLQGANCLVSETLAAAGAKAATLNVTLRA